MEGLSIIIPVYNKIEMTLRCIEDIRSRNRDCEYEIIVFDNGSTDDTPAKLSGDKGLKYIRSRENLGISRACNEGAERARYPLLCFMHNDLFISKNKWIKDFIEFFNSRPDAGVIGLYGAKVIRRDGSYRGKGIVHSKKHSPTITRAFEPVAVVDGLLMAIRYDLFAEVGGFNTLFTIHYYDKDLSMKTLTIGYKNYVLNIPFEHRCGRTRKTIADEDRVREELKGAFLDIWKGHLPCSVMGLGDWLKSVIRWLRG
jgi:GT2 family glycosyltransferase